MMVKIITTRQWDADDIYPGRKVVLASGTHLIAAEDTGAAAATGYYYVVELGTGLIVTLGSRAFIADYLSAGNGEPQ